MSLILFWTPPTTTVTWTPLEPTRQLEKRLERQPATAFQQLEAMFCGDFGVLEKKQR